jgi:predicted transcriptional regulator
VKSNGTDSFYAKNLREKLRLNPMTVNRYMRELENRNFIKRVGGNRKKGFEYEVANWEEYSELQKNMDILNEILESIKTSLATNNIEKHKNIEKVSVT